MDVNTELALSHLADCKYYNILEEIKKFQDSLDYDHEVAIYLASFGTNMKMIVKSIGYQNPDILYFYGTIDGNDAELIQHMNQLNFLLMAVQKPNPDAPPNRIKMGFSAPPCN